MAHAIASSTRYDHMSPVAAGLAAVLHVATAFALFWVSPLHGPDLELHNAIDVTIEQPKPPEPPPEPPPVQEAAKPPPPPAPPTPPAQPPAAQPAPPPPPPPAAAKLQAEPKPQPKAVSNEPLGITPEAPKATEPKSAEAKLEPQPQPQPEAKPEPKQEAAAVAPPAEPTPPPPPEKPLEKALPPVEAPAAPLSMRDFVKVLPPPPAPPPSPPASHQAPPPQHTAPQTPPHSPLSTAQPLSQTEANNNASVSSFVNPAAASEQTRAKDAYLWQVIHKFSQYLPDLRGKSEGGTVILRFVIARDGRLVEASVAKSSGVVALDRGLLDSLRAASPYPPLPAEIPGNQAVFVQPIAARR